ncbi:MAG: thioredoxin fold domain-containing protein [Kiritimatiellia bacterium]
MKKILMVLALAPMMGLAKTSTPKGFTDNMDDAFAAAKASGRYVYACFSGSDWCGWCKKLDKEVFAHKEFLDGVTNDYVLVFIDNPSNQDVLSEHAKKNNRALTEKYEIRGFPSAIIFSPEGEQLAQTGYQAGGPAPYVKYLMGVRKDGPDLKKRAEAEKAFLGPYKDRVKATMDALRKEFDSALKVQKKKACASIEAIIKDFESAKVPEGLSARRDEYLEELNDMKKMFSRED